MNTTTLTPPNTSSHYCLGDAIASEWTKLTSVRSAKWTLLAFSVLTVAIGAAAAAATGAAYHSMSADGRAAFDPTNVALAGLALGELAMGVLGVLMMSGEYSSGTVRSTFAAIPNRPMVLAAKAIVLGGVAVVLGEAVTFVTFLAGQALIGPAPRAALSDPRVLRAVVGSGAFLGLIGLFGVGLGTIIRHSAGAIGAFVGIVLVLPVVVAGLPGHIGRFTPEGILSSSVAAVRPQTGWLSPWVGLALMALYATVALGIGAVALARRDV